MPGWYGKCNANGMRATTSQGYSTRCETQRSRQLPPWKLITFAFGQMGWSLASFGVGNLVAYFYMPPEAAGVPLFPSFVFQGAVLGVFTIVGVVTFCGKAFESLACPLVASWSDRSRARLGRRRFFMLLGAAPLALFSLLVFVPLTSFSDPPSAAAGWANATWLAATVLLFYFFFAVYTAPYSALVAELGRDLRDRLRLSASISVAWALGYGIGTQVYQLQGALQRSGMSAVGAFQVLLAVSSASSLVLMLTPVIFIDEGRPGASPTCRTGAVRSIRIALGEPNFLRLMLTELLYWVCQTMMQLGLVFSIVTLLRLDRTIMSGLVPVMFVLSFACYFPVVKAAGKFEKKRVLLAGLLLMDCLFLLFALMGRLPVPGLLYAGAMALCASLPMAILGIIPNAIVADVAEADRVRTGESRAAMFFAIRFFADNLGMAIGSLLFASFLALGKSIEHPAGVRASSAVSCLVCLLATVVFASYDEAAVLRSLERKAKPADTAASAPGSRRASG